MVATLSGAHPPLNSTQQHLAYATQFFCRSLQSGLDARLCQHLITLFVGEQLLGGFLYWSCYQLPLELQIISVFSQFLLSLSIVPNNGCNANKHFLLLLAACSSNLDLEGGWEILEADIREASTLGSRQFSKNFGLSSQILGVSKLDCQRFVSWIINPI